MVTIDPLKLLKDIKTQLESQVNDLTAATVEMQVKITQLQALIKNADELISTHNNEANSNGDQAQN